MDQTRTRGREILPVMAGETEQQTAEAHPQKTFLSGVGILTSATVLSKVIGLFFRIPLVATIGIGGMAYFLAANHIYVTLYLVAAAGLPLAVSILVSERNAVGDFEGAARVYRVALGIFLLLGGGGSLFLFFGAGAIAEYIGLPGAGTCIAAISPTLLFACVSAAIRGYFQGYRNMVPTAVSEVIESVGKLLFGLGFSFFALRRGYDSQTAAAFAIFGLTVGVFASTVYLALTRARFAKKTACLPDGTAGEKLPPSGTLLRILRIAAPVTCSSLVLSIASVVDTLLISGRLQDAGFALESAKTMYSSYGNLALPLFNLPASLITPISLALVPLLSAAFSSGKRSDESVILNSAMRLTALLAIPASVGLSVFSGPILHLLYPSEGLAVSIASPLLSLLSVSVLMSCFMTITNAILSTYGHPGLSLLSMAIGAGIKIAGEYFLVGNPTWNIYGAPISTFLCNLVVASLNLYFMQKYAPGTESVFAIFGKPLAAALVGVGGAAFLYYFLTVNSVFSAWKVLFAVSVAAVGYCLCALVNGALRKSDLALLPAGRKLSRLFSKSRHRV